MLKSLLNAPALQPIISGQIRHLVTVGGTWLAANGYIGGSEIEALTGAVMVIVMMVWSAVSKKIAA